MHGDSLISVVIPTYRDGDHAAAAAAAIAMQRVPTGMAVEILVVDDGSDDGSLADIDTEMIRVIRLPFNQGRSIARNAGAAEARGEIIAFMDCDCLPIDDAFLLSHINALRGDHVASTGHVVGSELGFWGHYQRDASARRERQHQQGLVASGSSQNLAVRKAAFQKAGGFETHYVRYGFEDRDLLVRLSEIGPIAWALGPGVRHLDALRLVDVSRKLVEAGEHSSTLFATRHPSAYRALGYAAIDARRHRSLRVISMIIEPHLLRLAQRIDSFLDGGRVPYPLAKAMVKAVSAFSFLQGTTRADK